MTTHPLSKSLLRYGGDEITNMHKDYSKKTLTRSEYLHVLGLFTIAREYHKMVDDCERAIEEIVGYKGVGGSHFGDEIYGGNDSLDSLLKRLEIKVLKK